MRAHGWWILLLSLQACGGGASSAPPPSDPPPDEPPPPASSDEAAAAPSYEVHEWGLIDVDASGAVEVAAGPGRPQPAISVRKPVLYVRLDDGLDTMRFAARVQIPGGTIVEHWPAGQLSGDVLEWPAVEAGPCAPTAARETPRDRVMQRACDTPDGYCEVFDLPGYVADGSACLDVGGVDATLLFYRGALAAVTLPYRVSRSGDAVVVEAARDLPAPVGELWRIRHDAGGSA
ncbi:MAG: hypothetical protein KC619_07560, partial [Myxococcales bacterium]|nr:hypothetical protein [Myxococcales bacterium]